MKKMQKTIVSGGCHCGQVQFEIRIPDAIVVQHCNCSICTRSGFVHLIIAADDFTLIGGKDSLTEYRFNTGLARHLFCSCCGVKSFYVPRSNPDGFSINLRCLQLPSGIQVEEEDFNGQEWEQNAARLRHLSG